MSGIKVRCLVGLSNQSAFHRWPAHCAARMLLSDKLRCCGAGTNGCFDLRRRAFPLGGLASAEWSKCPCAMAWRARDSVAPLRWSPAGLLPASMWRLSAGVGRRHPVTIRKASLMAGSIWRVWAPDRRAVLCGWMDQNWWVLVRWVQRSVSTWDAVHLHSVDGWAWTDELLRGRCKWVSRFEAPCIRTRWTGERWVEQMSRLHGTASSHNSQGVVDGRIVEPGVSQPVLFMCVASTATTATRAGCVLETINTNSYSERAT